MSGSRWENDEREILFNIAKEYDYERMYGDITTNTPEIIEIHKKANLKGRDVSAILFKLKEMKFITGPINGYKFKKNKKKKSTIDFYNNPCFKPFNKKEEKQFEILYKDGLESCQNITELQKLISEHLNISELNALNKLYEKELITINDSNNYILSKDKFKKQKKRKDMFENEIKSRKVNTDDINKIRGKISKIYSKNKTNKPKFVSSYDGTGFGKSWGVVNEWIEDIINKKWSNGINHDVAIFSTPIKSQQKKDSTLIEKAENNGIRFLSVLAESDIYSLDHKDWITGETNEDKYKRWCSTSSNKVVIENSKKIKGLLSGIRYCEDEIKIESKNNNFNDVKNLEDSLLNYQIKLKIQLEKFALDILNYASEDFLDQVDKYKDTYDMYTKNRTKSIKEGLYAEIVMTVFPLYYALHYPCCLMMTTNKSDTNNIKLPINNKNNIFIAKNKNLFHLISKTKEKDDDVKFSQLLTASDKEQLDFLKNEFYRTDEENHFEINNISFTFINDEEHEAYNRIAKNLKKNVLTQSTLMSEVFTGIYRCLKKLDNEDEKDTKLYKEINDINNDIKKITKEHCKFSDGVDVFTILDLFKYSTEGIWINGDKVEQVMNLTKNAFSFTNKDFINSDDLKNISIKANKGRTKCEVYTKATENDKNPTLYDIFQAAIAVIAVFSKVPKNSVLMNINSKKDSESHHYVVRKFIKKTYNVKSDFEYMFDQAENGDIYINRFLTYFQPKVIFSIIKDDNIHELESIENKIKINFNIELRKELPEVKLQRILMGKGNSIISLSATTGIDESYAGGLNRNFLKNYSGEDNLDYNVIQRTHQESNDLNLLREKRNVHRNININCFNEEGFKVIDFRDNKDELEFQQTYKHWEKSLLQHMSNRNIYKEREVKRTLHSLLKAAFDEKNTLSLSLSGMFSSSFKKLAKSDTNSFLSIKSVYDHGLEKHESIYEIQPFKDKCKLRVILYDAALDKTGQVEKAVQLQDLDTKIAFISTYQSAGTGLNYYISYMKDDKCILEEDFERNILINSPFYSTIKSPEGMNTIDNRILLLKHIIESGEKKKLSDISTNLISGEYFNVLMTQHYIEILKQIIQSVGRTERKDTKINSEIYISDEVMGIVAATFNYLSKNIKNETFYNSMSLANTELFKKSKKYINNNSFSSKEELEDFKDKMEEDSEIINDFLNDVLMGDYIYNIRQGKTKDYSLNELLRSEEMYTNPKQAIKKLKSHPYIIENEYESYIDSMYINKKDYPNILFAKNNRNQLTDINNGNIVYNPSEMIHFNYHSSLNKNDTDNAKKYINMMKKPDFSEYIPHPALMDLLKGNYGEIILKKVLNDYNLNILTPNEVINNISPEIYEKYDFYIDKGDTLICIDAKYWGVNVENQLLTDKLIKRSQEKSKLIKDKIKNTKYKKVNCVYINCKINKNEINTKNEIDALNNIYYLNLFIIENKNKFKESADKCYIAEEAIINNTLKNLLAE